MHRLDCPLPSGRIAMWKCLPVVLLSPVITTFVNGWDTLIYLLIIYTFVILLLVTFRNLCREWTTWLSKIPNVKEKDVLAWYEKKHAENGAPELLDIAAQARSELSRAVDSFSSSPLHVPFISGQQKEEDPFVRKMAIAHPYAMWLLKKEAGDSALPETYTTTWFVQLELAVANQRQLTRALKEHSPFITYRYSRYDVSTMNCDDKILSSADALGLAGSECWSVPRCPHGPMDCNLNERQKTSNQPLLRPKSSLCHLRCTVVFSSWRCGGRLRASKILALRLQIVRQEAHVHHGLYSHCSGRE